MPFVLGYDSEAIIPIEVVVSTMHSDLADSPLNEVHVCYTLDQIKEKWEQTQIKLVAYHYQLAHYYNFHVKGHSFQTCGRVLQKVQSNTRETGECKLGPN